MAEIAAVITAVSLFGQTLRKIRRRRTFSYQKVVRFTQPLLHFTDLCIVFQEGFISQKSCKFVYCIPGGLRKPPVIPLVPPRIDTTGRVHRVQERLSSLNLELHPQIERKWRFKVFFIILRCYTEIGKRSLIFINYINFRSKIQLDHPVKLS